MPNKTTESQLFDAIKSKDLTKVKSLVEQNVNINLDCLDEDQLTPLQHACHLGDLQLATYLIDHGADVNFTSRKDGYTAVMFAAIGGRSDIVKLLLERNVDTTVENCVNRNVTQMAAFVGQSKIVSIINNWISFKDSVAPYIRCLELETAPRIPEPRLGTILHNYIIYPSLNPIKLLLFIRENLELMQYAEQFTYVLEQLCSRAIKPPQNEECLALKYYYLSYLLDYCHKLANPPKKIEAQVGPANGLRNDTNLSTLYGKTIDGLVRRLIKRESPDKLQNCTKLLDHFLLECMMKFPYTQLAIFKTMTYALTKREVGDHTALSIFTQTLNGPRMFGNPVDACAVCGELDKNKKCSKCKTVHYCGLSCQRADWFQHKKVCRA